MKLSEGVHVIYVDQYGQEHNGLCTAVWGKREFEPVAGDAPAINIVIVDQTEGSRDNYGQQLHRETSVVHASSQPAFGRYWRLPEEARREDVRVPLA